MSKVDLQILKKWHKMLSFWGKALLIEIAVFEFIYVAGAIYFSNHFLLNTSINGVDVSMMSAKQAQMAIEDELEDYKLELRMQDGKTEYIRSSDIDLQFEIHGTTERTMNQQLILFWFVNAFHDKRYVLESEVTYNVDKLNDSIASLSCMKEENIIEPEEPRIMQTDAGFEVEEAIEGNKLDEECLKKVIAENLDNLMTYVDLDEEGCYVRPRFHKDSEEVENACEHLTAIRDMEVTYRLGSRTEQLTGSMMLEWVTISDEFEIIVDTEAVEKYIDALKGIYEGLGILVEFRTAGGNTVQLDSYVADDGFAMLDSQQLIDMIQTASPGNNKYEWDAANLAAVGNTYVEINLSTQHLYGYVDGELVVQSDIISGKPNHETQSGIYAIHTKLSPKAGDDTSRKVTYWLGFNGRLGIQDAGWETVFGGSRYVTSGSDGSIWMPMDTAKKLYESFDVGSFVIIYSDEDIKEEIENNEDAPMNPNPSSAQNPPTTPGNSNSNATTQSTSHTSSTTEGTQNNVSTGTTTETPASTVTTESTENTEDSESTDMTTEATTSTETTEATASTETTESTSDSESTEEEQPILID